MSGIQPAAPAPTPASRADTINTYGRIIVSAAVMLIFVVLCGLVLTRTIAPSETVSLVVGSVISMATGVVGYWIGSSAGSTAKDARASSAPAPTVVNTGTPTP